MLFRSVLTDNGLHFTDPRGESWTAAEIKELIARKKPVRIRRRPQVIGFQDFESDRLRCSLINSTSVSMPKSVNAMTCSSPGP